MRCVLVVGDWQWPWYQEACSRALESLGCQVLRFGWNDRFKRWVPGCSEPVFRSWWLRMQSRAQSGPAVWQLQRDLVRMAAQGRPDVVFFYNVQLIDPATVRALKAAVPGVVLCQYANDNPFSARAVSGLWRKFLRSIPEFHLHFAYRQSNVAEFRKRGAREVPLLRSYFIPEDDFPIAESDRDRRFECDVVFAGHYENDGRLAALEAVMRAGFRLKLFGGGWSAALPRLAEDSPVRALYPISPVTGADYRQAICGAKAALCFLSSMNCDTYTRRSFQIPAMGVAMLSQRTADLTGLFAEDREACFFESTDELLQKLKRLVADKDYSESIAAAGRERVWRDEHHVAGRMKHFLLTVSAFHRDRQAVQE
ncbi:MAG: hypothetical protein RL077_4305 [Verrucomicrobiota bacterium]